MAGEYTLQGALVRRGEPPDVPYDKGIDQRKNFMRTEQPRLSPAALRSVSGRSNGHVDFLARVTIAIRL